MNGLKKSLEEDPKWESYQRILKRARNMDTFEKYVEELETMHAARLTRRLHHKTGLSPKDIIDASLEDAAYRSRCTEIMIQVGKVSHLLAFALEAITTHILVNYKTDLIEHGCKTQAEKKQAVESLLSGGYKKMSDFDAISEHVTTMIEDLDKTSYALSSSLKALEIIYRGSGVGNISQY